MTYHHPISTIALSQDRLKLYFAGYPEKPPKTTALEQQIQIGTGFHGKWYRSQRECWLGWLVAKNLEAHRKGRDPSAICASARWKHLLSSPMMFWVAECAGVSSATLDAAADKAVEAAQLNPMCGHPHGKMIREVLPWHEVENAILSRPALASSEVAAEASMEAFSRLCQRRSEFRRLNI